MTDATWSTTPGSGDFNTSSNWIGGVVPDGIALFGTSTTTSLSFSADTGMAGWELNLGAADYNFAMPAGRHVTLSGEGIVVNGGSLTINLATGGSLLEFSNISSAGAATINLSSSTQLEFNDTSTAGTAEIQNDASVTFFGTSTAGSARITSTAAVGVVFNNNSDGGNASFVTNAGALVEFAATSGPAGDHKVHAGSIDGAGSYYLGSNRLIVGSNAFNTEASGLISDGDGFGGGGTGASLVKTGIGKLILSHADNTYTGGTFLRSGILELGAVNAAGTHAINFTRHAQTLQIDDVALSSNTISNKIKSFGFGDAINLHDLAFTTHAHVHYNSHTHKLKVTSGGITDKLVLIHPEATTFKVVNAGIAGGTKIKLVHSPAHANALAAEAAAQKQASDHNSDGHHALMGVAAVFDDSGFQFRDLDRPRDTTLDWHHGLASLSFGSQGEESLQAHRDMPQAVSHGSEDFQGWAHNLVDHAASLGMHDFLLS